MRKRRITVVWLLLGVAGLLWAAAGFQTVHPEDEVVIVASSFGGARILAGPWGWVPAGWSRVVRVPRMTRTIDLPGAEAARIPARDGSLFGYDGSVTVSPAAGGEDRLVRAVATGSRSLAEIVDDAVRDAGGSVEARASRRRVYVPTLQREFRRRLLASLEERGLRLDALDVRRRVSLFDPEPDRRRIANSRLLVVGLDGADWSVLDPLLDKGRLPHLRRLIDDGVRAKLQSISPMISPVVWTTMGTGVPPERHGVLDFLVPAGRAGEGEPVTSAERLVPAVWNILSDRGVTTGVVGWWATWPAESLNGYLVTDRVAYQLFGFRPDRSQGEGKTWPPDLYAAIEEKVVEPSSVGWDEVLPYLAGPRTRPEQFDSTERKLLDDFRTLLASGRTYLDAAIEARKRFDPDFETVYFEGTDTVGHLFMPYRDPPLDGIDPDRRTSFRMVVDRYYETVDGYLGELLRDRGPEWTVMVVSDHGFADDEGRPRTTDSRIGHGPAADWHRRFGVLVLSGAHVVAGSEPDEASVLDIAPTILGLYGISIPESWPGRVLGETLERSFLEAHPVLFRTEEFPGKVVAAEDRADLVAGADSEALREKLQSLGYIAPTRERPSGTSGDNNRGVALLAAGRFEAAEEAFRRALNETPGQPMVSVNLALALRFQGKTGEAERLFEAALFAPPARRTAGLQLAQIAMERGDLLHAEELLRGVLEVEPGAGEIRNSLGLVLERSGRTDEAVEAYRRAAAVDPDAAEPRNNLGNLARRQGRLEEAEAHFLAAIEADPFFMGAYNNLALLYQDRGELERAIALYGRALEKAPDNAVVLNNLGSLYFATGDLTEARALWQESSRLDEQYASPRNNLAGIALTEGELDRAETLLREAIEIDPDYGDARINLALIAQTRGDEATAREELERASEDPRATAAASLSLAALELRSGDAPAAVEHARRAISAQPRNADAWALLGEAYRHIGRETDARAAWERALQLRPDNPSVREALERLSPSPGQLRAP